MQEMYNRTELIITEFDAEDVITTSGPEGDINTHTYDFTDIG